MRRQEAAEEGWKREFEWDNGEEWETDTRAAKRRPQRLANAAIRILPFEGMAINGQEAGKGGDRR